MSVGIALLLTALAGYSACCVYIVFMESRLIFKPNRDITATPARHHLPYQDVEIVTEDGIALHGWFVQGAAGSPVVLLCHGNSGNISDVVDTIPILHAAGMSIFTFDYRGYGASAGTPSEQGTYRDAMAVWTYLTQARAYSPDHIIVFGRSLGAAVAIWLASQVTPRALVVEAGFSSIPDLAQRLYPWLPVRKLASIHYNNQQRIGNVTCPALFIHSRDDELIPIEHGRRLHEAHRSSKQFVEIQGTHATGYLTSGPAYSKPLHQFLSSLTRPSS